MEQSRRNAGVALVLTGLVTGCPEPEPYNGGTYVYDGYGTIERDPDCKLTGPLELTLGEGDGTSFTPLAPGQEPVLYHGPQGGTHLILGVAVANPAVGFPGMQFKFEAERLRCFSDGECTAAEPIGSDEMLVSRPDRFLPGEGGSVNVSGFLVVVWNWNLGERRRLQVEAMDPCGRTGTASVELGLPASAP